MIKNKVELLQQRRQTRAFLDAESTEIVLVRRVWADTASGGRKVVDKIVLAPQRFRLAPFKRRLVHTGLNTPDGKVTDDSYVLTGFWDCDVQDEDRFELDDGWYEVNKVNPRRDFRTVADVRYRGVQED